MSDPSVRGIVHLIEPTKTYGKNNFRKRLVVLEQKGTRFTNYIPLDFIQDNCDAVDQFHVGDDVEVFYRLSGRKWQRDENSDVKFFLSAEAIRFQVMQAGDAGAGGPETTDAHDESEFSGDDGDVPF